MVVKAREEVGTKVQNKRGGDQGTSYVDGPCFIALLGVVLAARPRGDWHTLLLVSKIGAIPICLDNTLTAPPVLENERWLHRLERFRNRFLKTRWWLAS
jgi:hypothetical protein